MSIDKKIKSLSHIKAAGKTNETFRNRGTLEKMSASLGTANSMLKAMEAFGSRGTLLRANNSRSSKVIDELVVGQVVTVLRKQKNWIKV